MVSPAAEVMTLTHHTRGLRRGLLEAQRDGREVARGYPAELTRAFLKKALEYARPGDTLVVRRLDRLGGALRHLIETVADLQGRGVGCRSLTERIDTTTPGGKLVFRVFGALAEFERDLIRERTQAGLAAART